jgi:deoxyribodipyrimidine photo-lyase
VSIAIHWFRRDLRLRDNSALTEQRRHNVVLPVFVLDDGPPRRMGAPRLTFLLESLADLARELERLGCA